ncbi:unnamed protein product [Rhizoctonia solani]|uniref:Uncharacterized protein n=1 Tax=Rhizoctonia solani TaxID=456999 RepID=A0A8H3DK27_9AGAM|nr:unnamed protein product [Rhizoctonia solani]
MQPDNSLLSSLRYTDHGGTPPSTNRGLAVTHIVGRYTHKRLAWLLCLALGAAVLVMTLYNTAVWIYPIYVEPLVGRIMQGQRTMIVFATFFFPRLADVHSRAASGTLALVMFLIGSILAASAGISVSAYATGAIFYIVGSSGLYILIFLLISDYTSLQWRGISLAWIYFVPIITMWIEPRISEGLSRDWAFGTFGIIMFVICTPALVALHSVASRHSEEIPQKQMPLIRKLVYGFARMDPIGLLIFTIGFSLVDYGTDVWWDGGIREQPSRTTMPIVGYILVVPVFTLWEVCFAPFPLLPKYILKKQGALFAIASIFCCRAATALLMRGASAYSHSEWSFELTKYYFNASSMGNAIFAPIFGCLFLLTRRYKLYLILGGVMLLVSSGLALHSVRNAYLPDILPSTAALFSIQILKGVGEVAIDLGAMIGSQASVPHSDLATLVGLANVIPIFATVLSPTYVTISIRGHESGGRIFVILYSLATGLAVLCLIFSFFVPDYRLGNTHNAVEQCEDDNSENATTKLKAAQPSIGNV